MTPANTSPFSRRALLGVGAASAVAAAATCASAQQSGYDPRVTGEGQAKLIASLDGVAAFWAYSGIVYAVRPKVRPLPILALSGCQVHWVEVQPDKSYHMDAKTLTFFRAHDTGAFLDHFDNPFTGASNEVRPNIFSGGGGAMLPADGSAMRITGAIKASESAPKGFAAATPKTGIGRVEWTQTKDCVVLATDHAFNVKVQPQLESQTRTADRAQFFDPNVKRLPARYAATTISPWLAWMEMGDADGHLVWHTSGEKVFNLADLPEDYRAHAGSMLDDLAVKPKL